MNQKDGKPGFFETVRREIYPVRYSSSGAIINDQVDVTKFYYVYVLRSLRDGHFYTGLSNDLARRIKEHDGGEVFSTRNRRPLILIYFEGCLTISDAARREKYLKTAWGKRYLKNRMRDYLTG